MIHREFAEKVFAQIKDKSYIDVVVYSEPDLLIFLKSSHTKEQEEELNLIIHSLQEDSEIFYPIIDWWDNDLMALKDFKNDELWLYEIYDQKDKEEFNLYKEKLNKETAMWSMFKLDNENYLKIVGMDKKVIPILISELLKDPDWYWFFAIETITGEKIVQKGHEGKLFLIAQDFIEWGKNVL